MSRPPLEVADVVRQHGAAFLARYGPTLSGEQHRALRAIAVCRTAALGGHITQCDHCGHEVQAYNSCRHRCCPKCHGTAQAAWLAAREREVLETPYVHVIFTLPHDLSALALQNPRHLSMACSFARSLRRSRTSLATPSISVRRLGALPCCTRGANNSTITPISIVSCPPGAWLPMAHGGCRVGRTSSYPSASSRVASGTSTSRAWHRPTRRAN